MPPSGARAAEYPSGARVKYLDLYVTMALGQGKPY